MFGAFIGDIVGSKYEFNNIKTKDFPLFSHGCDYTDDSIMTTAVAEAIILSQEERNYYGNSGGRSFQEILVQVMQDYGKRYPNPTGAYGSNFATWLQEKEPKPYNSFGNGSAMRVSPCGLVAVELKEAIMLARASAAVSHNHPEGIKGAEAVAAAIFLAKIGASKLEIRKFITDNYYNLEFSLKSVRPAYSFDGSCQGSVPQALMAFFESTDFEDAIRNAISIGGDSDTLGAITGSIAWIYYAFQNGGYTTWIDAMYENNTAKILEQAKAYLPKSFVEVEAKFREICWRRAGVYHRVGTCSTLLSQAEIEKFGGKTKRLLSSL